MPLNSHDADDTAWMDNAVCKGAPLPVFVPNHETERGLQRAQAWCQQCPVRTDCLMWAMLHHTEGYWGGTDTYQRNQLRRVRTRAKCPLCLSKELAATETHELCLACGASWVRDVRLQPIAATPAPPSAA